MRSLAAKVLLRVTLAILVLEGLLVGASVLVRRAELRSAAAAGMRPAETVGEDLAAHAARLGGAALAVAAGTAALLYLSLRRIVLRPINTLIRYNEALTAGQADAAVIPDGLIGGDEMGDIMRSRNRVVATLQAMTSEVDDLNAHLELLVARRTAELQSAYDRLKQSQAQLVQSEKLATVGMVAAGIVHELAQPLNHIQMQAGMLLMKGPEQGCAEALELIRQQADAMRRVMDNLRRYARKPAALHEVNANKAVENACAMVADQLRTDNVELLVRLDPRPPPVWADEILIQQIVLNLVVNAWHAVQGLDRGAERRVRVATSHEGAVLVLTVADTGPGIPPEARSRVFEPFFTTKPAERGTGLGLSITRSIVEELGGAISFESAPGRGTTFRVALPARIGAAPEQADVARIPAAVGAPAAG